MLIANSIVGMDGIELLERSGPIDSVLVTSTNLVVKFRSLAGNWKIRFLGEQEYRVLESYEELTLTPDQAVRIFERHGQMELTPVSFKNQQKGFRVKDRHWGPHGETTNIAYVALSDTPVQVSEDDVEGEIPRPPPPPPEPDPAILDLIARHGEKKAMEIVAFAEAFARTNQQGRATSPPVEEEGGAAASPPSRLWLYVGIALCLFPILYFLRRKLTNH